MGHASHVISIRPANQDDLSQVLAFQVQWAAEVITHGFVPGSLEELTAALGETFLVAETVTGLVGFITASTHVSEGMAVIPSGATYLELDDVYVTSEWRGHGVGRSLVDAVLTWADTQCIEYQLVYSATKDIRRILTFYEECGFSSWCVQLYRSSVNQT